MALIGTTALSALDANIVGPAIPSIVGSLKGLPLLPWLTTAFLLTSTVSVPVWSKLADRHARKPVLLVGITLFLLGSALCGLAGSMEWLIAFRGLQGLGAGAVVPVLFTLIGDIYPLEERARIQGVFSAVWGVSGVGGPLLGGAIVSLWNWPWIFLINVPVGMLTGGMLVAYLLEPPHEQHTAPPFDWPGALLLSGGITAALLALQEGKTAGWSSPELLALLVVAGVALVAFWRVERRAADPLLPHAALNLPVVRVAIAAGMLGDALLIGGGAYLPLLVQGVWQGTPLEAGLAVAPLSLGWPLASTFAGRGILRWGYRPVARTGAALIALGALGLITLGAGAPVWLLPLTMFIEGLGYGLAYPSALMAIQNAVPWSARGATTGLLQFARNIGATTAGVLLGFILTATLAGQVAHIPGLPVVGSDQLGPASQLLDIHTRAALAPAIRDALIGALSAALHPVLLAMALLGCGVFVVNSFFPQLTSATSSPKIDAEATAETGRPSPSSPSLE